MNKTELLQTQLDRVKHRSLITALLALPTLFIGAFLYPEQFFQAYLVSYLFWISIVLGCLGILMLHNLTGGEWGVPIRAILEAATKTLPLMIILFLPLLAGMNYLYVWSRPEIAATDELLQHKQAYLNTNFFFIRSFFYFFIWTTLAHFLNKWSLQLKKNGKQLSENRLQSLSSLGLIFYVVTGTLAYIDWVMSIDPHWYSTIYGLLFIVGQILAALAFLVAMMKWLANYPPLSQIVKSKHFHDLGNLILAFVMLWAYMAFSQYLIIWSGNITEEIPWYLQRMQGGWQWTALFLIIFHFALPFLLLLSRTTKKTGKILSRLAIGILFMRLVDLFWTVAPSFSPFDFSLNWIHIVAPIGLGGLWITFFVKQLKEKLILPNIRSSITLDNEK